MVYATFRMVVVAVMQNDIAILKTDPTKLLAAFLALHVVAIVYRIGLADADAAPRTRLNLQTVIR